MRNVAAAAAAAVALSSLLQFKFFPDAGKEMTYEAAFQQTTNMEFLDENGKVVKREPVSGGNTSRWREKTVTVRGGKRLSFVRTYEVSDDLAGVTLQFDRPSADAPYAAHALKHAQVARDVLAAEARAEDGSPFALDEAMLPNHAVAAGARWTVDPLPIVEQWKFGNLKSRGAATATLASLEMRNGHRIATIVIPIDLELAGDGEHRFDRPVPLRGTLKYEACVDGSSTEYHSRLDLTVNGAMQTLPDHRAIRESMTFSRREDQNDVAARP